MNPSTDTTLCSMTVPMSSPHVLGLPRLGKARRSWRLRLDSQLIGLALRRPASCTSTTRPGTRLDPSTPARGEVSRPATHTDRHPGVPAQPPTEREDVDRLHRSLGRFGTDPLRRVIPSAARGLRTTGAVAWSALAGRLRPRSRDRRSEEHTSEL